MFTKCPQCQTAFRVTAPMLEAAQGRVRCGRCGNVFNALSDFLQSSSSIETAVEVAAEDDVADDLEEFPESALEDIFIEAAPHSDEAASETVADVIGDLDATGENPALKVDVPVNSIDDTAEHEILDIDTGEFEVELELDEAPAEEAITLEGKSIFIVNEATGEFKTNFAVEDVDEVSHPDVAPDEIDSLAREQISASLAQPELSPADFAALAPRGAQASSISQRQKVWWRVGSGVFLLLLIAQILHVNRQALARTSAIGPALSRIYAAFGSELSPAWDLYAYEIRQWGASADADANGMLKVRASVFNGAEHAQPYPLLRLTLQDRFGGRVGARDVEPDEYLQSSKTAPRLLGPGERIDAEIAIVDPGKDAVGFEIDVCLRGEHNSVTCANDAQQKSG